MTYYSKEEFFELDESAKAEYYDRLQHARKEAVTPGQKEALADAFGEISGYYNSEEFSSDLKAEADRDRFSSKSTYKMDKKRKIILFALIFVAVVLIVTTVVMIISMSGDKKSQYEDALSLYQQGKFEEAREIFASLGDYDQSKLYIVAIDSELNSSTFNGVIIRTGDTVKFGKYEQDGLSETEDDIEWIVLDVVKDEEKGTERALLLSKYIIDIKSYGGDDWKSSSIRFWLNGEFFDTAFKVAEQDKVVNYLYYEYADKEQKQLLYECSDYVSIPSVSEIAGYASEATVASADVSGTVKAVSEYTQKGDYWLRTYFGDGKSAFVFENGLRPEEGADNTEEYGVRPMIWVKLDGSK